jgi:hypothetical protein
MVNRGRAVKSARMRAATFSRIAVKHNLCVYISRSLARFAQKSSRPMQHRPELVSALDAARASRIGEAAVRSYVAEIGAELAGLAHGQGLTVLGYLLDLAVLEAHGDNADASLSAQPSSSTLSNRSTRPPPKGVL